MHLFDFSTSLGAGAGFPFQSFAVSCLPSEKVEIQSKRFPLQSLAQIAINQYLEVIHLF